ncbi:hypothetical protein [Lichenicoccus sp.]|uniref:hypothetical protein n=1 Tax=Lichenicoccus sp. TaxID=2781899 RepID=UPI003D0F4C68
MIRLPAILLAILHLNAGVAFAADQSDSDLGNVRAAVLKTVAAGALTLQILPAGGDDNDLLWGAWDGFAGNTWTVHVILLHRREDAVTTASPVLQEGGRSPLLEILPGWRFGPRPALLVRYQLGAADSRAEIYGVGANDTATRLDILEGALIEGFQSGGKEMLRVYETADLHGVPKCFGWNAHRNKLSRQACDRH